MARAKSSGIGDVSAEADMTPMIDMTFQLIAFFMILINFAESDSDDRIQLPSSVLAKPPEGMPDTPITLQVTKNGTVLYSADEIPISAMGRVLDIEAQLIERAKKSPSQANIIIRADAETPTGQVQEVIKICQQKKFEKFLLRAKQDTP